MPHRPPTTLSLGLTLILLLEPLLAYDLLSTPRGALHTEPAVSAILSHPPTTPLGHLARWTAVNFTALIWPAYILFLDGLLTAQTGSSPLRQRPKHFTALALFSIPAWLLFDWVNFSYIHAWTYIGLPPSLPQRLWGYTLAFASITPAMLLTGQALLNAHLFDWAQTPPSPAPRRGAAQRSRRIPPPDDAQNSLPPWLPWTSLLAGAAMFAWPFLARDPISNLTLWAGLVFLIDPLNYWLGRPSVWRDWHAGRFARTLAAFAGGLTCGLLWEFWNYYALAKWTYHLPFLGPLEHYKYFEMPLPGLLGFLPFSLECWTLWQLARAPLDPHLEPLPDDRSLI